MNLGDSVMVSTNFGGTMISGATLPIFIPNSSVVGTTFYYCVVTTSCGSQSSLVSGIHIVNPSITPILEQSTLGQTICEGGTFNPISITVIGTEQTYQWYSNTSPSNSGGTPISSAIGTTYTPNSSVIGTVYYYCMVTTTCGNQTSTISGAFTVNPPVSITLISAFNSDIQKVCFNSEIVDIRYSFGNGVTNGIVSGLPIGLISNYSAGILEITGTSNVAGEFTFIIDAIGGCTSQPVEGSITINPELFLPVVSENAFNCIESEGTEMTAVPTSGGIITWSFDNNFDSFLDTGIALIPNSVKGVTTYYVCEILNGCSSAVNSVDITFHTCKLEVTSAFTPDGDDVNDTWEIIDIDKEFPNNTVTIYDRWGLVVFASAKGSYEDNNWDGKFNGSPLPVDSYMYIIEYNDGITETTKGTITIILRK